MISATFQERLIEMNKFTAIFLALLLLLFSHPSYPYNSHQCDEVADTLYGYKWFYKVFGMITQLNECALIDGIKIETGGYYQAKKAMIDSDVRRNVDGENLDKFGIFVGCEKSDLQAFSALVISNKDEIFGKDFEHQPRTVMLNLYKKLDSNEKLKVSCKR